MHDDDEYRQLDVARLDAVETGFAGAHAVLHLAANASATASWDELRGNNIEATQAVFGAARRAGIRKVVFASSNHDMSMLCLRIGWFATGDPDIAELQGLWVSARDLAQLVLACLRSPRRFGIYNATSDNPQRHWSLDEARDELGYTPVDSLAMYSARGEPVTYIDPRAGVVGGRGD